MYTKETIIYPMNFAFYITVEDHEDSRTPQIEKPEARKAETRCDHCPGPGRWCAHLQYSKRTNWVLDTTKWAG